MSKQIVVALDGSEHSLFALKEAADLANDMGGGLGLLYVFPYVTATMAGLPDVYRDKLSELKDRTAEQVFDRAEAALRKRCPVTQRHLLWGDPAEEIIGFMKAHPDTLMVMGRLGKSPITRLVLGSVSDKVVRYAPGMVAVAS